MTIGKFFSIFFLQAILLMALKFIFFTLFDYHSTYWEFLYWAVTVVIVTALVRRLGVINFLEAIFAAGFWLVFDLILDFVITQPLSGVAIFSTAALWGGYIAMIVFVFALHKKRHIHVRRQLQAAHHGHH